jgi:hypothetical protein
VFLALCHLRKRYILQTRNEHDESTIVIRNIFSGNFIEIPPVRWATFLLLVTDIEEAVGKLIVKEPTDYVRHFGGGYYVSVISSNNHVDLRRFYLNERGEIKPTTDGIDLSIDEWCDLMNQLLIIMSYEPNLTIVRPCHMREDHLNNPNVALSCRECFPFNVGSTVLDEQTDFNFDSLSMN